MLGAWKAREYLLLLLLHNHTDSSCYRDQYGYGYFSQ